MSGKPSRVGYRAFSDDEDSAGQRARPRAEQRTGPNGLQSGQSGRPSGRPSSAQSVDIESRIQAAKRRLISTDGQNASTSASNSPLASTGGPKPSKSGSNSGLNIELHPLLRRKVTSLRPSGNPVRAGFDPLALNPYLEQSAVGGRQRRALAFNQPGKYIARANEQRKKEQKELEHQKRLDEIEAKGLTADELLGEQAFKLTYPPNVEWWDAPYLKGHSYDSELVLDNEQAPVSIYISHPVLLDPTYEKHMPGERAIMLTKKEQKRIRRNERQERLKDQQDRIKLGLVPPPPPKVKLSNLMNVLTNEAIRDPTAVEMRVRQEVEDRYKNHMKANEERKLTKEQRHEKIVQKQQTDLEKGYVSAVYRIESLDNPQHNFKVDINAKQLGLLGLCVINPRFTLVVVEGGAKSMRFYKKLLTQRIAWQPPNKCTIVWEGQLRDLTFKKWSVIKTNDDEDLFSVLSRFRIENYWREAQALDED